MFKKLFGSMNLIKNETEEEKIQKIQSLSKINSEKIEDNYDTTVQSIEGELLVEDSRLITELEKCNPNLKFTKEGIITFFNFFDNSEDFKFLYEKGNLLLHCNKRGSHFTKDFYVGKSQYKISKSKFLSKDGTTSLLSIEHIRELMYEPEIRLTWDKGIQSMRVWKENIDDLKLSENCFLVYNNFPSPVFFISTRDVLEKRINFYKDGVFYDYTSSVNGECTPEFLKNEKSVVRIWSFFNLYTMWEDQNFFYFKSFNQVDMKMPLPESFFNMLLPYTVFNYYTLLEAEMEKIAKKLRTNE